MHELLAKSFGLQARYTDAADEWRKALRYAPGDTRLTRELARALWLDRDYESSRPLLENLIAAGAQPAEVYLQLGDILQRVEGHDKALPHLEAAVRHNPKLLPARAALGRAYLELDRPAEAIPHLQAALPVDDQGALLFQLSRAFKLADKPARLCSNTSSG
jgi:tetratricopeptide (TPR) repeat protein